MQANPLFPEVLTWVSAPDGKQPPDDIYCQTRDIFQARLDIFRLLLERDARYTAHASLIVAVVGEIGNNSFDHNIGNWRDIPGISFSYDLIRGVVVCADRGQGIRTTLQHILPEIKNDADALQIAFTKTISGRAPEQRGNGLKFVYAVVTDHQWHLDMYSGNARATVNSALSIDNQLSAVQGCFVSFSFLRV